MTRPMPPKHSDLLARQRRVLLFVGLFLLLQTANTVFLWRSYGRFPVWSGIATLGLLVFALMTLRQYRRLQALPPGTPGEPPKRKRRRLRDPKRKGG